MFKKYTPALLLLVTLPCWAADWVHYVDSADQKFRMFVDKSSIVETGDIASFWNLTINVDRSLPFDSELTDTEVNCERKTMRERQRLFYLKGKLVYVSDRVSEWKRAVPNTIGEATIQSVCDVFYYPSNVTYTTNNLKNFVQSQQKEMRKNP